MQSLPDTMYDHHEIQAQMDTELFLQQRVARAYLCAMEIVMEESIGPYPAKEDEKNRIGFLKRIK